MNLLNSLGFILLTLSSELVNANPVNIQVTKNITYATFPEKDVQLDLYSPKIKKMYPGIILVHGGGWTGGSRQSFHTTAVALAKRGYVVANIDYRLATEAVFPGAVQDTKAAVRWLRKHANQFNVDPNKISAIGGSAGGHLVAMAALNGHSNKFNGAGNLPDTSSKLQAVIIMGAGVDQVKRAENAPNNYVKNAKIFFAGSFADKRQTYEQGSPITHVSKQTPPILMLDGGRDNPGKRYVDFIRKLKIHNVSYKFKQIPKAKHGQWSHSKYLPAYINAYDTYLREHLN
ncbi:alpha/beta hydrolase fold domain-containing protein [Paraglaciecola sp.]|uniref:alpha/beta hydrolase fold domain-containing protein n=1 Tax=Paraglaciecola sp. TaxID=1920173 RepID=UPI003EF2E207